MQLVRFADPAAYYAHVKDFLERHEAEHCLMLGICSTLIALPDPARETPYLAAVQRGDQILAAAVRTPPHDVVLSLIAPDDLAPAVELLARDLHATYGASLPGVIGHAPVSAAFSAHWHTTTAEPYRPGTKERIYKLEQVQPPIGVPGRMRPIGQGDHDLIARWIEEFQREALPNEARTDSGADWVDRTMSAPSELRGMVLWEDGTPVSLAGYGGRTPHGMRIGPVYTPPEQRGKGYARALTAALSQQLLDSGRQFVFLFTDLANPTSNYIYQAIGYRPVCDVDVYEFGQ